MSPMQDPSTSTPSSQLPHHHHHLHPHKPAAPKSRSQSIESVIKQEVDWITLLDELKDKREKCNSRIDAILREMMQRRAGYRNDTSSTAVISHEPVYNLQLELDRLEKRSIELTSMIRSAKKRHVASMPAAPIVKAKAPLKTGKRARQRQAREFLKDFYAHNPDGSLLCQWYSQTSR